MFLYDKKDNKLDVYSFNENKDAMVEYRQNEMLAIPERERVVVAESYSYDMSDAPLFEFYAKQFDTTIIPMEEANSKKDELRYHLLKKGKTSKRNQEILLDSYYYGHLSDRNIVRIQDLNKLRYYLLYTSTYTAQPYDNRLKRMDNIIELPESLFLLQMLEQEKFVLIGDKDISEQLDLFTLDYIDEVSLEELVKMDTCGITQNAYEKTLKKANNDAHIIKLVK